MKIFKKHHLAFNKLHTRESSLTIIIYSNGVESTCSVHCPEQNTVKNNIDNTHSNTCIKKTEKNVDLAMHFTKAKRERIITLQSIQNVLHSQMLESA